MSKASQLAQGIIDVLETITKSNGYQTDIGLRVYWGQVSTTPDTVPFVSLREGGDKPDKEPRGAGSLEKLEQPYVIEGQCACDVNNPNAAGHQIVADIKKALFNTPLSKGAYRHFGGVECVLEYKGRFIATRAEGTAIVVATVAVTCKYPEDLTNP